ncbi:MAG: hypothetical protein IKA71_05485 [Lentisphaeria bacterium]|nr:hypothetical protein [Lentisphaeria bacterium]
MGTTQLHISWPLPDGSAADIAMEPDCKKVSDMLADAHHMYRVSGNKKLSVLHVNPESKKRLSVSYSDDIPEIQIGQLPQNLYQTASMARDVMFLTLRPLLESGQMYLMHGGLTVDTNGNGCIFCGPSGVGKSTAVAKAGKIWEILSDDLIYLSWYKDKLYAQPGPTWSSYLFNKERLADCDIRRIVEVKNVIILSRVNEFGIHKLTSNQAGLMLANSFIEMVSWHSELALHDQEVTKNLRIKAFEGVWRTTENTPVYRLTSQADTDITAFLQTLCH